MILVVALAVSGCAGPAAPQAKNDTPKDVVINFWKDIDSGDYSAAYDITYHVQNISRDMWINEHRAMWGDNGTNLKVYNFTVIGNTTIDPDTFQGNFSAVESVIVQTDVAYYGKNTSGISQFAAVKTADGWKFFGSY
ncbi:MAG: hypothetical protein WBZ29_03385 [Methanocella sp.]